MCCEHEHQFNVLRKKAFRRKKHARVWMVRFKERLQIGEVLSVTLGRYGFSSSSKAFRSTHFSMRPWSFRIIFSAGSMDMATSMNSLSRNGTRASRPHADVDLLALWQSYRCSALIWYHTHTHE
jgi:hypothetical protein